MILILRFLKGVLKYGYFSEWCCILKLKKVKQGNKCYETQKVTFVIPLKFFNKERQTHMYTK